MQTITAVPAAGMARKRSYHLQPRCWNEYCWFNFSGEFETSLLNWLCKAGKEVVVSLPNFLCILISRSLSTNLNLKYTRVFKHKRIHNCITHSKVSRNTMASDAATFHNCRRLLHHTQLCTIVQDDVLRTTRRCSNFDFGFIWWLLVCQTLHYFSIWNVKSNGFPKLLKALSYSAVHEISEGAHFLHLACQGGARTPAPHQLRHYSQSKSAVPPSHGLKQSQAFQDGIVS